jgi:hypothetical protein
MALKSAHVCVDGHDVCPVRPCVYFPLDPKPIMTLLAIDIVLLE